VHHVRESGRFVPAGESSFADDATFGYASSDLASWLSERSGGRIRADDVASIGLDVVRGPAGALADALASVGGGRHLVVDAETDDDLDLIATAGRLAERRGRQLLYRIGPGLLRPLLDQAPHPPLTPDQLAGLVVAARPATPHGLVVVGSHVPLTTRQVEHVLATAGRDVEHVVVDVPTLLDAERGAGWVDELVIRVTAALADRDVLVTTSRRRVDGVDGDDSLRIARLVSAALVDLTRGVLEAARPAFVIGKGGITSSDLATEAVGLRRLEVHGSLLPGAISVWRDASDHTSDEEARRAYPTPYAVFPGNVGTDSSLADAIEAFRAGVKATG
jgi:uncharacterized protein YgbK (DUF1537 family)